MKDLKFYEVTLLIIRHQRGVEMVDSQLDFYMYGYDKNDVKKTISQNLDDLMSLIEDSEDREVVLDIQEVTIAVNFETKA